jgi:hypothetical protein
MTANRRAFEGMRKLKSTNPWTVSAIDAAARPWRMPRLLS